jgi:hypothetical protein
LLRDYLEAHFPELRIAFSHFRDVPHELAESKVPCGMAIEVPAQPLPTVEEIAELQGLLEARRQALAATDSVAGMMSSQPDLLTGYLSGGVAPGPPARIGTMPRARHLARIGAAYQLVT